MLVQKRLKLQPRIDATIDIVQKEETEQQIGASMLSSQKALQTERERKRMLEYVPCNCLK